MVIRRDVLKSLAGAACSTLMPKLACQENSLSKRDEKMHWWQMSRFGLFLHWGLYSVAAGEWGGHPVMAPEFLMLMERIPLKDYARLARGFTLEDYDPEAWVRLANEAGMKYIVITAKHHDGFAMYDSPSSPYNIVKMSPYGKDPMKPLAAACAKHGIRLCFYYSLGRDWEDPDVPTNWPTKAARSNTWDYPDEDAKVFSRYFERKVKPQVRELLTQYGPIGVLWFDTPELISREQSIELRELVLGLQPNCIINDRIGNGQGDFEITEQSLKQRQHMRPWESCITMSRNWGYNKFDHAYKTPEVLVRDLVDVVSAGGNFLLDTGPTPQGTFTPEAVARLQAIGLWMKTNSEAIYGTHAWLDHGEDAPRSEASADSGAAKSAGPGVMKDAVNDNTANSTDPDLRFTANGDAVYCIAISWRSPDIQIDSFDKRKLRVKEVTMLGADRRVKWHQSDGQLVIQMPSTAPTEVPVYAFRVRAEST